METIDQLLANNEEIRLDNKDRNIIISNCWDDKAFHFVFSNDDDLSVLSELILPKELFALYHKDKNLYEFIFLPLNTKLERSFKYVYCGKVFNLYYAEPTDSFECLAKHVELIDTEEINDRAFSLYRFNMHYKTNNEESHTQYYPTNFFIQGDFKNMSFNDHMDFFRHVNFMLSYYDRYSPTILFFKGKDAGIDDINVPCKSKKEIFPEIINSNTFDATLLELIDAANETTSYRLKFIFYFQVLEYCSYYYVENNLRRQITNIIKSPDILNSNKYSNKIIEIYSDYFKTNKDEKRMERLLTDLCAYEDIKDELITNSQYFINELQFEGGFCVKGLFKTVEEIDNPPQTIINTIRKNIDSIRNVLVHARESRENTEIKPTQKNVQLLQPYLYLLRRIAETVVIKYE